LKGKHGGKWLKNDPFLVLVITRNELKEKEKDEYQNDLIKEIQR
jgi:hypothetical protein